MSDASVWFPRLEKVALVEIVSWPSASPRSPTPPFLSLWLPSAWCQGLSMFACLGAPEQAYNCALGFYVLNSAHVRVGRLNLQCMHLTLLSFVADVLALACCSDRWARAGALSSLALALLILLLFVKSV